jgi:hypothetical protein
MVASGTAAAGQQPLASGSNGHVGNGSSEGGNGRGGTIGTATAVWATMVASGTAVAGQQPLRWDSNSRVGNGGGEGGGTLRWDSNCHIGNGGGRRGRWQVRHRVEGTRARHSTSHWCQGLGRSQQRRPNDRDTNRLSTGGCRDIPRRRCRRGKGSKKVKKD